MAYGDIGAVIDEITFDGGTCGFTKILHVINDIYVIAHRGTGDDGYVHTVSISDVGDIGGAVIDSLEFDTVQSYYPDMIRISANVFAVCYMGPEWDGWLCTFSVSDAGDIGGAVIDSWEFDDTKGGYPRFIHISGNIWAIAYDDGVNDGQVFTVSIADNGTITKSKIDILKFDAAKGDHPAIIHIADAVYAISYVGPDNDGWLCTFTISDAGVISNSVIDTLEFEGDTAYNSKIIHVVDDIYAIAYNGPGATGWLCTVSISGVGNIGAAVIDSWEFDGSVAYFPEIIFISGNIYAIAYKGVDADGWILTITISTIGTIGADAIDRFEFNETGGCFPSLIHIADNIYAMSYESFGSIGKVLTLDISTKPIGFVKHLPFMGVG
ncbi:hypothetical protein ES703_17283 [subsurface metagenome]